MSLKAKLEAVIYASEEPVTLAQLAALFAGEAMEWKAQQDAAATAAKAEATPPRPMIDEGLQYLGLDQTPAFYASETASESVEPSGSTLTASQSGDSQTDSATPVEGASAEPVDPDTEAKRQARVRDREVKAILRQLLDEIISAYAADDRGIEIREIAGGYRLATKPECHDAVRLFIKTLKPPLKLSLPALETLAVIAYKQPVTAPEVNEIRGVESGGVLGSLLSRKLIATAGRKQVIGRPILYKTTKEFLLRFGLKDVSELPSMEEFEKMAAIELSEPIAEGESEETVAADRQVGPELDENASEDPLPGNLEADTPQPVADEPTAAFGVPDSPGNEEASQTEATASNEHIAAETASHDR